MMNLKPVETRYFYEIRNTINYITDENDEIQIETKIDKGKNKTSAYFMLNKSYVTEDENKNKIYNLIQFKNDFNKFNNEIKDIEYKKYFNDKSASICFLHRMSYKYKGDRKKWYDDKCNHQSIKEFMYIEKCFNGGLTYFNDIFKDKEIECHSYDFSSEYGQILGNSNFKFPMTEGKYYKSNSMLFQCNKQLPHGLYNVKVTINDDKFCKIFEYSLENWYDSYIINYLLEVKAKYNIDLFFSGECIIYDERTTEFIDKDYFNCVNPYFKTGWYNYLQNDLKQKYKKNYLVKNLISKIWGAMSQKQRYYFKEDDFMALDCSNLEDDITKSEYKLIDIDINKDGSLFYECIKTDQPTKLKYSRIKPFITGYSRVIMYRLLEFIDLSIHFNNIVRINTDGITLNCPIENMNEFKCVIQPPLKEDKTSGLIKWSSLNSWSINF